MAELAAKHPEKNNVQIAELAGVSEGTVRNVRKSMSQDYDIEPHLEKTTVPTIDKPPMGDLWEMTVKLNR